MEASSHTLAPSMLLRETAHLPCPSVIATAADRSAHERLMAKLISSGEAKNTQNRSPSVPAGRMTGVPARGPRSLESTLKRRAVSKKSTILPSAMVTEYAPRE
jgi:hypothetical protein